MVYCCRSYLYYWFLCILHFCLIHFRTFANRYQFEIHHLLVALGWASNWEVGRKVDDEGDCGFDAILAQLEDRRIGSTIDPIRLRGITTPQGSQYYNLRNDSNASRQKETCIYNASFSGNLQEFLPLAILGAKQFK